MSNSVSRAIVELKTLRDKVENADLRELTDVLIGVFEAATPPEKTAVQEKSDGYAAGYDPQHCPLKEGDRVQFKIQPGYQKNFTDKELGELMKVKRVAGLRWSPGCWVAYLDGEDGMFHVDCLQHIGGGS